MRRGTRLLASSCEQLAAQAGLLLDLAERAVLVALARLGLALRERPVVVRGPVDEDDSGRRRRRGRPRRPPRGSRSERRRGRAFVEPAPGVREAPRAPRACAARWRSISRPAASPVLPPPRSASARSRSSATQASWCSPITSCTILRALDELGAPLAELGRGELGGVARPLRLDPDARGARRRSVAAAAPSRLARSASNALRGDLGERLPQLAGRRGLGGARERVEQPEVARARAIASSSVAARRVRAAGEAARRRAERAGVVALERAPPRASRCSSRTSRSRTGPSSPPSHASSAPQRLGPGRVDERRAPRAAAPASAASRRAAGAAPRGPRRAGRRGRSRASPRTARRAARAGGRAGRRPRSAGAARPTASDAGELRLAVAPAARLPCAAALPIARERRRRRRRRPRPRPRRTPRDRRRRGRRPCRRRPRSDRRRADRRRPRAGCAASRRARASRRRAATPASRSRKRCGGPGRAAAAPRARSGRPRTGASAARGRRGSRPGAGA